MMVFAHHKVNLDPVVFYLQVVARQLRRFMAYREEQWTPRILAMGRLYSSQTYARGPLGVFLYRAGLLGWKFQAEPLGFLRPHRPFSLCPAGRSSFSRRLSSR